MSPIPARPPRFSVVHVAGTLALAAWATEAVASHSPRFAGLALCWIVQGITWAAFALAARRGTGPTGSLRPFLAWAVAFRLVAAWTSPLLENDHARHLWDGWRMLASGNPYDRPPSAFFRDATVPETLQEVLSEVNYPDVPTIYGPVLQGWSALAAAIHPGRLWPFKLLLVAADLAILALLWRGPMPRAALWYGWCPLVIHETCANAHADVLAVLPCLMAWIQCRTGREIRGAAWLGIAVATKLTAAIGVPFLLAWRQPRAWVAFGLAVAIPYLPFWLQGSTADWDGLRRFAGTWEFNSSVVGLLGMWLAPPVARAVAGGAGLAVLAWLWWRWRGRAEAVRPDWVFGIQLAAGAVANPWYLVWIAPFASIAPSRTAWVAMGAVALSYATALNLGLQGTEPFAHPVWVRPAEYGLILAAFGADLAARRGIRTGTTPTPR